MCDTLRVSDHDFSMWCIDGSDLTKLQVLHDLRLISASRSSTLGPLHSNHPPNPSMYILRNIKLQASSFSAHSKFEWRARIDVARGRPHSRMPVIKVTFQTLTTDFKLDLAVGITLADFFKLQPLSAVVAKKGVDRILSRFFYHNEASMCLFFIFMRRPCCKYDLVDGLRGCGSSPATHVERTSTYYMTQQQKEENTKSWGGKPMPHVITI